MFVDKQSLIRVNQRQKRAHGLAYFHKQLDVFIVLISMTMDTSFPVVENVSNHEVMSGIPEITFQSWLKTLDPNGIWIRDEIIGKSAVLIRCVLCAKHREWLRLFRNFSDAFLRQRHYWLCSQTWCTAMGAGKGPLILKLGHSIWICSGRIFDNCPSLP